MINWFKKKEINTGNQVFDRYLQQSFKTPKDLIVDDLNFVVLDCEMTGLDKQAELVSLGAVKVTGNRINVSEALDLKFSFSNNNSASEIHGELMDSENKSPKEALIEILNFVSNWVVVGHSISIDISQLNKLFTGESPYLKLKNQVLDTYQLMRRLDPTRFERSVAGQNSLRLDALCQELNVPVENRHTALGDAYMTAQVLLKLLSRLKGRGVTKAGQLIK